MTTTFRSRRLTMVEVAAQFPEQFTAWLDQFQEVAREALNGETDWPTALNDYTPQRHEGWSFTLYERLNPLFGEDLPMGQLHYTYQPALLEALFLDDYAGGCMPDVCVLDGMNYAWDLRNEWICLEGSGQLRDAMALVHDFVQDLTRN
jgi:hypothetical protein